MPNDLELDIVVLPDGEKHVVNRRSVDARIWGGMTDEQQLAAEMIAAGYMIATNGLRTATQQFERSGGRATEHSGVHLMRQYKRWLANCHAKGLDPSATIYVLVYGYGYSTVDRATKKRRHTTRKAMMAALALF